MKWSTPQDLKTQVQRLWERGEFLRDILNGTSRFPLRLSCKGPGSADLTNHFEQVREWANTLANSPPVRVEWQEVRHRVQGQQQLPARVYIDSLEEALLWLGKKRDFERFQTLIEQTRQACPALLTWLAKRPLLALELASQWHRMLAVAGWLQQHPKPGLYLRQVDLPGVHSKFIESHRGVLSQLLDLALPAENIAQERTGASQFEARYGFMEKPLRVRFRVLDALLHTLPGLHSPDITLDAGNFSRLSLDVKRVLITENETNFLSLPAMAGTLAIFGSGYGWEALSRARWLTQCELYYWGDIDTHGFVILDQLRAYLPHVKSLLMDLATLKAHEPFWGQEEKPVRTDLHNLTQEENALYRALCDNLFQKNFRLEQEHLGFGWVRSALDEIDRGAND